jgi:hypothetical protein
MSERDEVVTALTRSGVLDAVSWAWTSAVRRTRLDYDADTGHDQVWLGLTAHKLFCDRLDRVFHCRKYAVDDAAVGRDVLALGLASGESDTMPSLSPGAVVRADVTNSPGWRHDRWHWLISSYGYGGLRKVSWSTKTPAKRRHAGTAAYDDTGALFSVSDLDLQSSGVMPLVVAHAVNSDATDSEFHLGRPRLDGAGPWAWTHRLDTKPWSPAATITRQPPAFRAPDPRVRLKERRRSGTGE